jgi:hypothetical protein
MIVRVRFTGKHYNSGLWPEAKKGDEKVMPKPLFDQLCKDVPNQFVVVSIVSTDEVPPAPVVVTKRNKGG